MSASASDIAIHTNGLSRAFGSVRAVEDLTIDVPAGSIYGFLGPNGAGKTTTIRLLLGLLEPSAGEARVLGHDVRTQSQAIREQAGVLLESDGLYTRLTAMQNLDYFGRISRLSASDRRQRIQDLLTAMGLWDRRDGRVADFSTGMRQKLALARAFLHRPKLLFLDEPTSGLDTPSAVALRRQLVALARDEGVTVFLTTHNLLEAEKVCDRVAVIRRGLLLAEGSPKEFHGGRSRRVSILGRGFTVKASIGHVRDLPKKLGIDTENGFKPTYVTIRGKGKVLKELREAAGKPDAYRQVLSILLDNPLPIVIPCHRVVTTKAGPGSYIAGEKKKIWLVRLEERTRTLEDFDS